MMDPHVLMLVKVEPVIMTNPPKSPISMKLLNSYRKSLNCTF